MTCHICPTGSFSDSVNSFTCHRCPHGSYGPLEGQASCIECPAGQVQGQQGQTACLTCQAGSYNPEVGAPSCQLCSVDTFSASGASECLACPEGEVAPAGSAACSAKEQPPCPPGRFLQGTDCTPCPAGSISTNFNSAVCSACGTGHFAHEIGLSECAFCPRDTFASAEGSSHCEACPTGFTSGEGYDACIETVVEGVASSLVLAVEVTEADTPEFRDLFIFELAACLGIPILRILITAIHPGSAIVDFTILDNELADMGEATATPATGVVAELQTQFEEPASTLRAETSMLSANVDFSSPPEPARVQMSRCFIGGAEVFLSGPCPVEPPSDSGTGVVVPVLVTMVVLLVAALMLFAVRAQRKGAKLTPTHETTHSYMEDPLEVHVMPRQGGEGTAPRTGWRFIEAVGSQRGYYWNDETEESQWDKPI